MSPEFSEKILQEWQGIVDLMARIINVPAGLIMRINEDDLEVFISSESKNNPYKVGDKEHMLGSGLYCETVIENQTSLLVPNALKSNKWKNNPDIKLNMISYLGFPINWPDGSPFGTICILDVKENKYTSDIKKLVEKFRDLAQRDLDLLTKIEQLEIIANTDSLTGILNRRALYRRGEIEIERTIRYKKPLSVIMMDVDNFKKFNDKFGHQIGDDILIEITESINIELRKFDLFGRFGGDEFVIVLPETAIDYAVTVGDRISSLAKNIIRNVNGVEVPISISVGVAEFDQKDTFSTLVNRADTALLKAKKTQ